MRLWTLHPKYLDPKGLTAVWREGLLAQAVLEGKTKGYQNHPQLTRFRQQSDPQASIGMYLREVCREAHRRGYRFDGTKIASERPAPAIPETDGQLRYEWELLKFKLRNRDPGRFALLEAVGRPEAHPLFTILPGEVREWERVKNLSD